LDTGSNIFVTWAVAMAALRDYYTRKTRRWALPTVTALMVIGIAWHFVDRHPATDRAYLIPLGEWGGFYPGETWLIGFAWLNIALFVSKRRSIARRAMPLLLVTVGIFFVGMLLATASNDKIVHPFIPLHDLVVA